MSYNPCIKCGQKVEVKKGAKEVYCRLHNDVAGLYDTDDDCEHEVVSSSGGGVKCTKCCGWFCF